MARGAWRATGDAVPTTATPSSIGSRTSRDVNTTHNAIRAFGTSDVSVLLR